MKKIPRQGIAAAEVRQIAAEAVDLLCAIGFAGLNPDRQRELWQRGLDLDRRLNPASPAMIVWTPGGGDVIPPRLGDGTPMGRRQKQMLARAIRWQLAPPAGTPGQSEHAAGFWDPGVLTARRDEMLPDPVFAEAYRAARSVESWREFAAREGL